MDLKILLGWLALNVGLLALILVIIRGWLSTRPMTGAVLAKRLEKETSADGQRPDFTLGEIAFLLRETGKPSEGRLLTALLADWHGRGIITCEMAPKKRLVSYGDDMQPTLAFTEAQLLRGGAEDALAELFRSGCTGGTLQSSEGYNWAQAHAQELQNALRRFEAEGRAYLRQEGAIRQDTKKRLFGISEGERLIYTPRGQRRALAMRRWENHLRESPETSLPDALLFGYGASPQPLGRFCEYLTKGFTAGLARR